MRDSSPPRHTHTQTSLSANATSRATPPGACWTRRAGTASRLSGSPTRLRSGAAATSCSTHSAASAGTRSPSRARASEVRSLLFSFPSPRRALTLWRARTSDRAGRVARAPRACAPQRRRLRRRAPHRVRPRRLRRIREGVRGFAISPSSRSTSTPRTGTGTTTSPAIPYVTGSPTFES